MREHASLFRHLHHLREERRDVPHQGRPGVQGMHARGPDTESALFGKEPDNSIRQGAQRQEASHGEGLRQNLGRSREEPQQGHLPRDRDHPGGGAERRHGTLPEHRHSGVVHQDVRAEPPNRRAQRRGGGRQEDPGDNHRVHGRHRVRNGRGAVRPSRRGGQDGAEPRTLPPPRQMLPIHRSERERDGFHRVG